MMARDLEKQVRAWAERGLALYRETHPLMSPFAQFRSWSSSQKRTLTDIICACDRTSESILLLVAFGQLWDAEILVRSACEGTIKYCYLLQSRDQFDQRLKEYAENLFDIGLVKDHDKVSALLGLIPNSHAPEWRPLRDRLLQKEELDRIYSEYDRKDRRRLETKWGFTGIVNELVKSGDAGFINSPGFWFNYSISSHIYHVDSIGAALPLERDRREADRAQAIYLAHAARLISDVLTYRYLRLLVTYKYVGEKITPLLDAKQNEDLLREEFSRAYAEWMAVEYPSS